MQDARAASRMITYRSSRVTIVSSALSRLPEGAKVDAYTWYLRKALFRFFSGRLFSENTFFGIGNLLLPVLDETER